MPGRHGRAMMSLSSCISVLEKLFRRELQGLKALHAGGIAAPAIRYSGTAGEGAIHVILLEPVQPAMTLEAAWEAAADEQARIGLLGKAVCTIAASPSRRP